MEAAETVRVSGTVESDGIEEEVTFAVTRMGPGRRRAFRRELLTGLLIETILEGGSLALRDDAAEALGRMNEGAAATTKEAGA